MKAKKKNSKQFNQKFKKQFLTRKSLIVISCTAIILVMIALGCLQLSRVERRTQAVIDELNTEIRNIEETNKSLAKEKKELESEESKIRLAKERLGMIEDDEYLLEEDESISDEDASGEADSDNSSKEDN